MIPGSLDSGESLVTKDGFRLQYPLLNQIVWRHSLLGEIESARSVVRMLKAFACRFLRG